MRRLAAVAALLLVSACLGPMPAPAPVTCPRPVALGDLWHCVDTTIPQHSECDAATDPTCFRSESALLSTLRVHVQDVATLHKKHEQLPSSSCMPPRGNYDHVEIDSSSNPSLKLIGYLKKTSEDTESRPIVVVAYGLYDSASSRYVGIISDALEADGFGVFIPEMRWHGCLLHLAPRSLSTLGVVEGEDLIDWAKYLRTRFGRRPIYLLGFSLGAMDVISAVSRPEAVGVLSGAMAVSPPGLLAETIEQLDGVRPLPRGGLYRIVPMFFRANLKVRLPEDLRGAPAPFAAFLEYAVQNESVFKGSTAAMVLASATPEAHMLQIERPLLVIASIDDPVFAPGTSKSLKSAASANDHVHVLEMRFGGHIGHFATAPKWFATVLKTFFDEAGALP